MAKWRTALSSYHLSRHQRRPNIPRRSDFREKVLLSVLTFALTGCVGTFLSWLVARDQREAEIEREERRYRIEQTREFTRAAYGRLGKLKIVYQLHDSGDTSGALALLANLRDAEPEWAQQLLFAITLNNDLDQVVSRDFYRYRARAQKSLSRSVILLGLSIDSHVYHLGRCVSDKDDVSCSWISISMARNEDCAFALGGTMHRIASGFYRAADAQQAVAQCAEICERHINWMTERLEEKVKASDGEKGSP